MLTGKLRFPLPVVGMGRELVSFFSVDGGWTYQESNMNINLDMNLDLDLHLPKSLLGNRCPAH
jgi:hypothetical protein